MTTHVCNPTLKEWRQGTCFCVGNTCIIIIIIKESAKFLKTLKHYKELKTWITSEIIQVAGEDAQGRTLVYCLQTLDSVHKTTKKKSGERGKKVHIPESEENCTEAENRRVDDDWVRSWMGRGTDAFCTGWDSWSHGFVLLQLVFNSAVTLTNMGFVTERFLNFLAVVDLNWVQLDLVVQSWDSTYIDGWIRKVESSRPA